MAAGVAVSVTDFEKIIPCEIYRTAFEKGTALLFVEFPEALIEGLDISSPAILRRTQPFAPSIYTPNLVCKSFIASYITDIYSRPSGEKLSLYFKYKYHDDIGGDRDV